MSAESDVTLWDARLADFREATASAQPTPGGGSVAGVSATLGLGLVIMALEISLNRKDALRPDETRSLIEDARRQMQHLSADADLDVHAFRAYMAALKLPKSTDEEKERRKTALRAASQRATEVPLEAARHMVEALQLAGKSAPLAHAHVVSDVGAGASLLEGALKAVCLNVDINLPSLGDAETQAACAKERVRLAQEGSEVAAEVLKAIFRRLGSRTEIISGSDVLQSVIGRSHARRAEFAGKSLAMVAFGKVAANDAARYEAYRISAQEKVRALTSAGFTVESHYLPPEITLTEFEKFLTGLRNDPHTLAVSVQMPVPPALSAALSQLAEKDLDAVADAVSQDAPICAAAEAALRLVAPWREGGVAVVGAKGFVGRAVCRALQASDCAYVPLDLGDDLTRVHDAKTVIAAASAAEILDARHLTAKHEMVVDVGFCPVGRELKKFVGNVSRGAYAVPARLTETPGGMGPLAMAVLVERLVERAIGQAIQKWSYPFPAEGQDLE